MKSFPLQRFLLITFSSLLLQLIHWLVYHFTAFPAQLLFLTPLILCAAYHAVQSDSLQNRGVSRWLCFFAAVLVPLLLSILVSVVVYLRAPDLPVFHPMLPQTPSFLGNIALFSGRLTITSFYLLVFSAIDVILLHWQDSRRKEMRV